VGFNFVEALEDLKAGQHPSKVNARRFLHSLVVQLDKDGITFEQIKEIRFYLFERNDKGVEIRSDCFTDTDCIFLIHQIYNDKSDATGTLCRIKDMIEWDVSIGIAELCYEEQGLTSIRLIKTK